jgi:hypothetical protein
VAEKKNIYVKFLAVFIEEWRVGESILMRGNGEISLQALFLNELHVVSRDSR